MNDDLNSKIKQIADILGQDTIPDNLKGLLALLSTTPGGKESAEEKSPGPDLDDNIDTARRIKNLMEKVNADNDPRLNLIMAIKPFLNAKRQKKLNNCMKLLQMSRLARLVDEYDKNNS